MSSLSRLYFDGKAHAAFRNLSSASWWWVHARGKNITLTSVALRRTTVLRWTASAKLLMQLMKQTSFKKEAANVEPLRNEILNMQHFIAFWQSQQHSLSFFTLKWSVGLQELCLLFSRVAPASWRSATLWFSCTLGTWIPSIFLTSHPNPATGLTCKIPTSRRFYPPLSGNELSCPQEDIWIRRHVFVFVIVEETKWKSCGRKQKYIFSLCVLSNKDCFVPPSCNKFGTYAIQWGDQISRRIF